MPSVVAWVNHLESKISEQDAYAQPYERRYRNEYILPFLTKEYADVYGDGPVDALSRIQPPRTGTAAVIVDALVERLSVLGATGADSADQPTEAVRIVERAWLENDLDVMHREAHRESLIKRTAFAQVLCGTDGRAIVGIESAEQIAVHREAGPPYDVDAALKLTRDEWTGKRKGRLWLPGVYYDLTEASQANVIDGESTSWDISEPRQSGFTGVPVVEFPAQARLLVPPVSEIEPIASLVDTVDLIEGLMVFAGHFGAVPIRWISGLVVQEDPKNPGKPLLDKDGRPVIGFNPRADHTWASTSPDTKFGQLVPASLDPFVAWAQHVSTRIRAKTGVASTYLSLDLKSHMSAELLKTDEAPMVRRIRALGEQGVYGQAWRRVQQLILQVENPALAGVRIKPRWADPQTRIESSDADIFAKLAPHLGAQKVAESVLKWSPADAAQGVAEADRRRNADPLAGLLSGPMTDAAASNG